MLCWIPPGEFEMGLANGSDNEKPAHPVKITRGFWLGQHEVTQGQYQALVGRNPSAYLGDEFPVNNVRWNEVMEFVRALNKSLKLPEGYEARPPTETEWEYACRSDANTTA